MRHRLVDRVVGTDQEIGAGLGELMRRRKHQLGDALAVAAVEAFDIVGQRMRVQRDFGVAMGPKKARALDADRLVAKRGAFRRTGDDSDMLWHGFQPLARGWAFR